MSTAVEGEVLCGATAAACVCVKRAGHVEDGDPLHECNPTECTGKWTGTYPDDDFVMVALPLPITPPPPLPGWL